MTKFAQASRYRLLPPHDVARQRMTMHSGRVVSGKPGDYIDAVPQDAERLSANGWTNIGPTGSTAARPTAAANGDVYHDTDVGAPVFFDGAGWRDSAGNSV